MTTLTLVAAPTHDEKIKLQAKKWAAAYIAAVTSTPRPSEKTMAKFRPIVDAANAAASTSTSTQWTGEPALRLFASVCHDMQALAVRARVLQGVPRGIDLRVMAGIPARLITVTCRLVAEATPAILNSMADKYPADRQPVLTHYLHTANGLVHLPLMHAHEVMQSEQMQIEELGSWGGQSGLLIANAIRVYKLIVDTCSDSMAYAPASNPQAPMVALEAESHIGDLLATLKHLATA